MDYRTWRFSRKERLRYGLEALAVTGILAFCFYNSPWALAVFPLTAFWYFREKGEQLAEERRKELKLQFRDAVQGMAAALAAGYSAENAIREAGRDLRLVYPESADMVRELAAIQRKLDANQTVEEVIRDFASRSGLEEAETFSEIFAVGKRSGGDLIAIMKDTARTISQTVDTERQAASVLASRRYEQKIMNVIPFAMVLYLRFGSPGFLDPVYGNAAGISIMTGCLALYLAARQLGKKLLEIEV